MSFLHDFISTLRLSKQTLTRVRAQVGSSTARLSAHISAILARPRLLRNKKMNSNADNTAGHSFTTEILVDVCVQSKSLTKKSM